MAKNVKFSPTTAIFYTYTLEEYPGRISDPPLRLTFTDAMELLQLRSMFRKATEELEAVRAKLEAEQERDCFIEGSPSSSSTMDVSSLSNSTEAQGSATCGEETFESSGDEESGEGEDVLSRTRTVDDASMKHKVEFVHAPAGEQPASSPATLFTPPASPLSPSRENDQADSVKNTQSSPPSSQTEPTSCAATSLHLSSPPASPIPSAPHSRSPTIRPFSATPRPDEPLPPQLSIPNNPSRNYGRPVPLSPTAKSLFLKASSPPPQISSSVTYPNTKTLSDASSCCLQDYQSISQDPNTSHPTCDELRPYGTCLVQV